MTWGGLETFQSNTSQFASGAFNGGPVTGSIAISEGTGTYTATSGTSTYFQHTVSGGDPTNDTYVAVDLNSFVIPSGASFLGYNPCFVKDNGDILMAESGPVVGGTTNEYSFRINTFVGGTRTVWGTVVTVTVAPPYRSAISIEGKNLCFYIFLSGSWAKQITVDVSSAIDLTIQSNLTGYRPGFAPWCDAANPQLVYSELQWGPLSDLATSGFFPPAGVGAIVIPGPAVKLTWAPSQPFPGNPSTQPYGYLVYRNGIQVGTVSVTGITTYTDSTVSTGTVYTYTIAAMNSDGSVGSSQSSPVVISTAPVSVYGKFVGSAVFESIEISQVGDIIPRIWPPKKNVTVFA